MDERYLDADDGELPSGENDERDEKSISSDLIRGHINTIILRSLSDGDKYGYEIIADIERKSHGQYSIKQPSLYSALKRLEKDGYITSYWGGSVSGGRRKYFSLTDEGKKITEQNQSEWEYSRTVIDSLISDKDFDFSNPAPTSVNMRVLKNTTSRVPSHEGGDEDYGPTLADDAEREKLIREYETKTAELEAQKAALEEERARFKAEMERQREELRQEQERQDYLLSERERLLESERQALFHSKEAAANDEQAESLEELKLEQEQYYEQLLREHEAQIERERAEYEKALMEREARIRESLDKLEKERLAHEKALAEQETRIRQEQEALFRQREQQLIHANFVNLVNNGPSSLERGDDYTEPVATEAEPQAKQSPALSEMDYRTVVRSLYSNAVQPDETSSQTHREEHAQSLGGVDFSDIHARADHDGIRIATAGGKPFKETAQSESLVNSGKALFLSGLIAFFYCLVIGVVAISVRDMHSIPLFFPYFIWSAAFVLLLVTGLLFANHYGERALRRSIIVLVNVIVGYILIVIVDLIVALIVPIDFFAASDVVTYIVIPIAFFFGIVVFGISYYLQVRTKKK